MKNHTSDTALQLAEFLTSRTRVFVLTGAGISTASGIPDYRDSMGNWKVSPPVQHRDYLNDPYTRQRYWARSLVGWPVMKHAQPNEAHHCLEALRKAGIVSQIVTQNVDRLHQSAGSDDTIDLHGRADRVICINCELSIDRAEMDLYCREINPEFLEHEAEPLPDGDARLEIDFSQFRVPDCPSCGGILKTDVVFFGDTVPRSRVDEAVDALMRSRGLLVVGSSLMVYSGFRFNRISQQHGIPQAALTLGKTRADELLCLKLDSEIIAPLSQATKLILGCD